MADSQEKKDERKKKLWVFLRVAAVGIIVLLIYMYMANQRRTSGMGKTWHGQL